MSKVQIDWTKYFSYEQMKLIMGQLVEAYPELARLHSIGKTHRGREILVLELTNASTGPGESKPALYIDANMHAEEFCGTSVALYIAQHLLEGYGAEQRATRLLDTSTFYLIPRLDPDGAEYSLQQDYPWCGNGRFLPGEEQPGPGFHFADVDGDGFICQMRIPDPNGEWKVSAHDPRLMVLRKPDEFGGTYYRLLPEGLVRDYDGVELNVPRPEDGNLNRNYPGQFYGPHITYGAGDYPLSEPETRAVVEWFISHPNIAMALSYHTHGGVILRPFANRADEHFHPEDLALYKELGAMGTESTGYPLISIYNDFTPIKSEPRGGTLSDWAFDEQGIPTIAVELWDVYSEAGLKDKEFYSLGSKSEDQMIGLLAWQERVMEGQGFVEWHPVDHPQFGTVEVGGWKRISVFRNPPGHLLEPMAKINCDYALRLAATLPHLQVASLTAEPFAGEIYKVSAAVVNEGYLSTYTSQVAIKVAKAQPVTATLTVTGGALADGKAVASLGHLSGRHERRNEWSPWGNKWGPSAKRVEWLVRVPAGAQATVTVTASCPRAGQVTRSITIN